MSKEQIEAMVRDLPDAEGARRFYESVTAEDARARRLLERDAGLLSDALALAAWSPFLGTTLAQHPDYLSWLARERGQVRVRSAEEFGESLGRFALTHSQLEPQVLLARFRRRELLRVYLQDVRRASTLVETTEELSTLADAVLRHALGLAQQELDNLHGAPQRTDARGRTARASTCVVALGKLGSRELNYASDIDLLFLYSDDGTTSGAGSRGAVTNREYFVKLAERVSRLVGQPSGEGAAYRVDLRLRPHGRDGSLSCSLAEAARYYRETAHAWELQALIRARASAGEPALYARFADEVRGRVYRSGETVESALAHVRLAKQKIDRRQAAEARGFNVKLGRGGIREIEFIAQALQLAYGGEDEWLRAPHTLISLGRLRDRAHLSEREHNALSDAYLFLRTLEHRLQMEHGLQTHTVPEEASRRALVARRMNCGDTPEFERELARHTAEVSAVYERVFGRADAKESFSTSPKESFSSRGSSAAHSSTGDASTDDVSGDGASRDDISRGDASSSETVSSGVARQSDEAGRVSRQQAEGGSGGSSSTKAARVARRARASFVREPPSDAETAALASAASLLARRVEPREGEREEERARRLALRLRERADASLNARRALKLLARAAASLDKSDEPARLDEASLDALVEVCGASEFFAEMLASNPALIEVLTATSAETAAGRDHRALLRAAVDKERSFGGELSALRRAWAHLLVELGACDLRGAIEPRESNRLQTALASAALNAGYLVARRELARRYGRLASGPRLAVLGLGRLGSGGVDYGSDLDIVIIYDESVPAPLEGFTHEGAYARLAEVLIASLSGLTRDGYLYRVDTRLRPDGRNGPVASASRAFVRYLRERAGAWEWLAYVKLRAVAGDLEFGRTIEAEARRAVHEAARDADGEHVRAETRRVRERLERERTRRAAGSVDIKFGAGGMLDVYFASRYLQLRDGVPDAAADRSTRHTLARLRDAGSLREEDWRALDEGYALLRRLDHHLRLLVGRSTRLPAEDHTTLRDLARRCDFDNAAALTETLAARMRAVRDSYDRVTGA